MTAGTTKTTGPATLAEVLDGIDATSLDCVFVNLAVLADRLHGPGTHRRLGAAPRFRCRPGPDGLPTVEPTLDERLDRAERELGLVVADRRPRVDGTALAALVTAHPDDLLLGVADGGRLGWTPYHGRQSIEHSFLVGRAAPAEAGAGEFWLVDAYHNDTEWGPARPFARRLGRRELAALTGDATIEVIGFRGVPPRPVDPAAASATREHVASPEVRAAMAGYVAAYRAAPQRVALERLALETWLLARDRRLHARWYAAASPDSVSTSSAPPDYASTSSAPTTSAPTDSAPADSDRQRRAEEWGRFAEHVFIALRRVRRDRPPPSDLYDRLAALLSGDGQVAPPAGAGR